jgi:hypothetical protein
VRVLFSKEATYSGRKRFEARLADGAWDGPKVVIEQVYGISKHGATKGQRLGPATAWMAYRTGMAPGASLARGTKAEMKDFAERYLTTKQNPVGEFLWEQAKKTPRRMWDIHVAPLKFAYAHPEVLTLVGPEGAAAAAAIHRVKGAMKQNPERTKKMAKSKWVPYSDADAAAWSVDKSSDKWGSYRLTGTGSALVMVSPIKLHPHSSPTVSYLPGVYFNGRWLHVERAYRTLAAAKAAAKKQYDVQARYEGHKVNPKGKARKNPDFGDVDRARARRIVKLAAKGLRASTAKSWLTLDERGTWEAMALKDLRSDKLQAKAAELGLTEKEVDEQIATYLGYLATDAALRSAKKGR